jgi:hypothetical protein
MSLARATLQQALFIDTGLGTRTCAIDMDTRSPQIIDPYQMLIEGSFKRRPVTVITQQTENDFESIIAQVIRPHDLVADWAQHSLAPRHPRLDMDEPVVASRQNCTPPERRHSPQG